MTSTLTVDIFVSLDGWAGGESLPGYFGYLGPELEEWMTAELDAPQRMIMGRKTYELLAQLPEEARDDSWHRTSQLETVVFSRSLQEADWPRTTICHDDPVNEIHRLKNGSRVPLRTVGSISLARQLLGAGVVDRLRLVVFPLIAGDAGREPFFADMASADLELVATRTLDGRVLLVEYRPTGRDIPRS